MNYLTTQLYWGLGITNSPKIKNFSENSQILFFENIKNEFAIFVPNMLHNQLEGTFLIQG